MSKIWLVPIILSLSACTFGVPIGGAPGPVDDTVASGGKSKYGNPKSYIVMGRRYYVMDSAKGFVQRGVASWYGPDFHGKRTSSGETYNMHAMTAAHKTLPLPTMVRVRNLANGKTVTLKVNDRGPFVHDRIIDLSYAAAQKLDVVGPGTAEVEVVALTANGGTQAEPRPKVRAIPLQTAALDQADIFIQIGSFGSEVNAINMRNQLQAQNESAIVISQVETDDGTFYRVRLGPLLDVSEADSVQKRLKRKGYSNTRIVVGEE